MSVNSVTYIFSVMWFRIVVTQDIYANSFSNILNIGDEEVIVISACPVRAEINNL